MPSKPIFSAIFWQFDVDEIRCLNNPPTKPEITVRVYYANRQANVDVSNDIRTQSTLISLMPKQKNTTANSYDKNRKKSIQNPQINSNKNNNKKNLLIYT